MALRTFRSSLMRMVLTGFIVVLLIGSRPLAGGGALIPSGVKLGLSRRLDLSLANRNTHRRLHQGLVSSPPDTVEKVAASVIED